MDTLDYTRDDQIADIKNSFGDHQLSVLFDDLHELIIVVTRSQQLYIYHIHSDDDAMHFRHFSETSQFTTVVVPYPTSPTP